MRRLAFTLVFFSLAAAASAQDVLKLRKTATASKELRVHGYVHTDETCESKELPEIELNIPPVGGIACVRPGIVRLQFVWSDRIQRCIGKRFDGALVIYVPFGSFAGVDTMQYTVRTPSQARTYEVEVKVEGSPAAAAGASSAPPEPQKAGPMPKCPALVS
jgi:hypothetical protein